ncbi:MAG TPA: hypothetical protein DCQ31_03330 [Bacteroidales bacterium]|nr:hypothetical protein [Bacteroidales bacterium]
MRTKLLIFLLLISHSIRAQSFAATDAGDFLKKACMFITWPDPYAKQKTFNMGIFAEPAEILEMKKHFENIGIKSVPVKIVPINATENFGYLHVMIIMKKLSPEEITRVKQMKNRPVLIISTIKQGTNEPGQIYLEKTNNKIEFTISESGIKNSGLQVSYILFSEAEVIDKLNY